MQPILVLLCCCLVLPWTTAFLSFSTHSRPRSSSLRAFSPRTEAIFQKVAAAQQQSGGAGGSTTLDGLRNLNNAWLKLKDGGWKDTPPAIVFDESSSTLSNEIPIQYDLSVSGGTLGAVRLMIDSSIYVPLHILSSHPLSFHLSPLSDCLCA